MSTGNKKTKILYVITKSNWGGAQRYVYDLATSLQKSKYDVAVVFGGEGELAKRLGDAGVPVISLHELGRDIKIFKDIASFFTLLKIFLREKPDIIHLNSSKAGGIGALAARICNLLSYLQTKNLKLKTNIIFTAHGWAFNEERGTISRFLIVCTSWLTIALSHKTITVSDFDRDQAGRMLFLNHKIIRIHNGVRTIKFLAKNSAREILLGERATSLNKTLWIGTIAELHNNKGLPFAIKAIHLLKEKINIEKFVLVIIGEGEERVPLEKLIEELGLHHNVYLVGKQENASSLLRAFDIFILPSIKEGLPYVILEAGIAGLSVLASAVGGISEIIKDMTSGILVKPRNPDEIALALHFLLTNRQKRIEFGASLKEKVVHNFSLKKMTEETEIMYNFNDKRSTMR
ncbi:MAG: glycosyltransferase family 4 protein [bacterium]|nr:glycosyltransferase family 4 protein [bacterium]